MKLTKTFKLEKYLKLKRFFDNSYFNSFKFKKKIFYTLLIDLSLILILFLVLTSFSNIIKDKTFELSQGKSPDQIKAELVSLDNVKIQEFLSNLKSFIFFFIGGIFLIFLISLLLFSFSRQLIWSILVGVKINKNRFIKWVLLVLILSILMLIYVLIFLFINLILSILLSSINDIFTNYFMQLVSLTFIISFLIFSFLTFYHLTERNLIFNSIARSFKTIKYKYKELLIMFLFILLTSIILGLISYPIALLKLQSTSLIIINYFVLLIFLAWMRVYLLNTIITKTRTIK